MNYLKINLIFFLFLFSKIGLSSEICGGDKINLEVSPYWEIFFYAKARSSDGAAVRFMFDTASNYDVFDNDVVDGVDKNIGLFYIEKLPIFNNIKPNFNISRIYSKSGSKKIDAVMGVADFIGETVELDLFPGQEALFLSASSCDATTLARKGYRPISQRGFYGMEKKDVKSNDYSKFNLPVVFLKIGSVLFPSEIDTGYRSEPGEYRYIKVNKKSMDLILRSGLNVEYDGGVSNFDCHGESRVLQSFHLDDGALGVADEAGSVIRSYDNRQIRYLLMEDTSCSDIASFEKPLALLDASFPGSWGRIVIDGIAQKVWIHGD